MARSAEAIHRRALKRNRSEEEQRRIDGNDMKKRLLIMEEAASNNKRQRRRQEMDDSQKTAEQQQDHPGLQEEGAWTCPSCGNFNFASRHSCHSKTCTEMRPTGSFVPTTTTYWKRPNNNTRHDVQTSKSIIWAPVASKEQIQKNHELRKRFLETTNGEGMSEHDVERAKILIARDERKKKKKKKKVVVGVVNDDNSTFNNMDKKVNSSSTTTTATEPTTTTTIEEPEKTKHDELRNKNKFLRKRYLKGGGKGLSEEEVARAQVLVARGERKKQKRLELQQQQQAMKKDDDGSIRNDKKKDRQLRKRFRKQGGVGMTEEDISRAKDLIAKAEEKKSKKKVNVDVNKQ